MTPIDYIMLSILIGAIVGVIVGIIGLILLK